MQKSSRVRVVITNPSKTEKGIEKSPVLFGIITTIITSLITIIGFGITYYQINLSEKHRQEDLADQKKKDRLQNILIEKQQFVDRQWHDKQEQFNNHQIEVMKRQSDIANNQYINQKLQAKKQEKLNNKQLLAFQKQADVSAAQYVLQLGVIADQNTNNRPIFSILSSEIDSLKSISQPTLNLHVTNTGLRTPFVKNMKFFVWNDKLTIPYYANSSINLDLNQSNEFIATVTAYKSVINDPNTLYFWRIYFYDEPDHKMKHVDNYFKLILKSDSPPLTLPQSYMERQLLYKLIKKFDPDNRILD